MHNDVIYEKVGAILKAENPCNIQIVDGKATCNAGAPCCGGCRHLGAQGCTVKSLACRFWVCSAAWRNISFASQIRLYQLLESVDTTLQFRFDGGALSKQQVLSHPILFTSTRYY